jgi:hypothetical protein
MKVESAASHDKPNEALIKSEERQQYSVPYAVADGKDSTY